MRDPKPDRDGDGTGGPPRSVQDSRNDPPSSAHTTNTSPVSAKSAPDFPAFVANSWNAIPMALRGLHSGDATRAFEMDTVVQAVDALHCPFGDS